MVTFKEKEIQEIINDKIIEIDCAFSVPFIGSYIDPNTMYDWFAELSKLIFLNIKDKTILSEINVILIEIQNYFENSRLVPVFFCSNLRTRVLISFLNRIHKILNENRVD